MRTTPKPIRPLRRSASSALPAADPATTTAAEQLRAELEGLVRIAARRPHLEIRTGSPNCSWSFDWVSDIVTVNPTHLMALAPDLCRGLALHEAAHAAVTVLHRILAEAHLTRIHPLLNTLEDIRIETWMRARFPGATGWIRAYNDVFYGIMRDQPLPKSRQVQFLSGILELWWFGSATPGVLPEVLAALDACREPIAAATSCQPPLDDDPAGIMASQKAMWDVIRGRILPTWERLVAMDRQEGIGRLASAELQQFAERLGCDHRSRTGGAARLRWSAGNPWGPRLNLRRAMQLEADPSQYRSIWCRPILPRRREPAVLLLIDRSSSMTEHDRIDRAFEGMVLLTEVCRRIGVAAAVWSFADDVREELEWDTAVEGPARRRLGMLPHTCDGNTDMATALNAAGRALASRRGDPKLLFLIGDGEPTRHEPTVAAVQRLEAAGVATVGLGLGDGTAQLARYFQRAVTDIPPERLVDHVADLLGRALLAG